MTETESSEHTARRRLGRESMAELPWPELASTIALVAMMAFFAIASPGYLSEGNVNAILQASAILIILVIGQTFVISTAGIDLSIASTLTLGAVVLGEAYSHGWGIWPSALAGFLAAAGAGLVSGLLVAKAGITDFIVTLGMLSAASGLALILSDGKKNTIIEPILIDLSVNGVWVFSWSVLIAIALAVVAHFVLFNTRFGLYVLAVGGSKESARAMGVRTWAIKAGVYVISGSMAGIAALLLVARVGASEPAANTAFLLNSVAAVVLGGVNLFGGRATIVAPVMGAVLLTALVNGLTRLGLSEFYQPLTVGIVVVLAAFLTKFNRS